MDKSNYSVEGNYKVGDKIIFEERVYHKATSEDEAIKMAREDGNIGSGMVFHNWGESEECNLGSGGLISPGRLFLMTMSKN